MTFRIKKKCFAYFIHSIFTASIILLMFKFIIFICITVHFIIIEISKIFLKRRFLRETSMYLPLSFTQSQCWRYNRSE